ncbi:MAG: EAL domain-containing protein [Woeseiaceae bacterium]
MKANPPRLHSLRKRALFFSAAISLLIVVVSISGYLNVKTLYDESSSSLLKREELLIRFNLIRSELLDSYKELNNFLLKPQNKQYQKNIIVSINEVLRVGGELTEHEWIHKYNRQEIADDLNLQLRSLEKDVNQLIKVRLDSNNQYPSLAVAAKFLQPNRVKLNDAFALAMNEMKAENTQTKRPEIYRTVIQARHLWTQVLSNFRIYLANRVGSFLESGLAIQEHSIDVLYEELQLNLAGLKKMAGAGLLGFETTDAIGIMLESSQGWYFGFEKIKVINNSDEWRQDAKIMNEKVSPAMDSIIEILLSLEKIVSESSKNDVARLDSLADTQNKIIGVIAFVGLFFTAFIIFSLDKLIFNPISAICQALKLEALGKRSDALPIVKTKETEDLVNAFNEMSRQVHLRQTELEYRTLHDALTMLPNRTLLLDRIEHDINLSKRNECSLGLLILDLDDFKEINDTLGHAAGDALLIDVGARLKSSLRDVDTVARIGGDEFSILLTQTNEEQAGVIAQKILSAFKTVFLIENINVSINVSIGISIYPQHGEDVQTLLRTADIAMYVAKRNKLGFEFYSKEADKHSIARLSLVQDFRTALASNELELYFQPIYNNITKNIVSVEALSRWQHKEYGAISPEKFVAIAEQSDLINELTNWVLDTAMQQVSQWIHNGQPIGIAVNLSVFSFKNSEFIGELRTLLKKHHFPSEYLKLEITESAMMENPLHAVEVLNEIHDLGIKLSIDDYGTGFSSMTYLKQLPVDELKIDKSFVIGLENDKSNDAIVRSTIDLAHNLGLTVVAEGIETAQAEKLLCEYDCDMGQGFYLSRPLPAKELEKLITQN